MARHRKSTTKVPGLSKRGTLYMRSYSRRTVNADGAEIAMAAKIIPPYVQPREYWVTCRIIGNALGAAPDTGTYWNLRGAIMPMDPRQGQVETDDVTGDELIARYMEPSEGPYQDTSDSPVSDIGIPGDEPTIKSDFYKKREIFRYRSFLGLPDKAVFNDANLVLLADKVTRNKKINCKVPVDSAKLMGFAVNLDVPTLSTDWGDLLWGNQGTIAGLAKLVQENFNDYQSAGVGIDTASHDSALLCWATQGFGDGVDLDQNVVVRLQLTIRCDVYAPDSRNVFSIS